MRRIVLCLLLLFSTAHASNRLIVGIAGGSGSGKTTLAEKLMEMFPNNAVLIYQDSYYKDIGNHSLEVRAQTNFDHPDSLDFALLKEHLIALKQGDAIDVPVYDFCTHSRVSEKQHVSTADLIIVEGILLFAVPEIRDLFDIKIFLDTDDDVRLLRRMERDMRERARDFRSIRDQYLKTVKPMYDAFVEPSKRYADVIIPTLDRNPAAVQIICSRLKQQLQAGS